MKFSLWSPTFRVPTFAALFAAGFWLSTYLPVLSGRSNLRLLRNVFAEIGRGNLDNVSNAAFAYALACAIVSAAAGLAFAMLILNLLAIRLSLFLGRRHLQGLRTEQEFKAAFDVVNHKLQAHSLVGHAWNEFARTCIRDTLIRRTVRPLSLINSGIAREHLFGLRLMPTIPGYFVGLGLLLTFIGLVIALSKAVGGVSGSPENMTHALRELLDAATFKFSTSIAGLFSSLALALVFKTYSILIDAGFEKFSREIEKRTVYLSPQAIMLRSAEAEREQLDQLKQINDAQFFDRLGQSIAPALMSAVERAVEPLTTQLGATVAKLESASRTGAEGLITKFTDAVQGSAGTELRELSGVLGQMRESLHSVQTRLSGSGEDFARRIAEATENFARVVGESQQGFATANLSGQATIEKLLAALTEAADSARDRMAQGVANAGSTVAAAAGRAAAEAADAIKAGFSETVASLRRDVDRMAAALRASELAFGEQNVAARSTVEQTNAAASAFGRIANDVSSASRPLLQASERIAGSSDSMARTISSATESFLQGQAAAKALADRMEENLRQTESAWRDYEARFGNVDKALSEAIAMLATRTKEQQQIVSDFVVQIDKGCAEAVQRLQQVATSLEQNTAGIEETFTDFLGAIPRSNGSAARI